MIVSGERILLRWLVEWHQNKEFGIGAKLSAARLARFSLTTHPSNYLAAEERRLGFASKETLYSFTKGRSFHVN